MASYSSILSEEQFLCSICLDVFTEPVTTPCGHNFCKACISVYWDSINDHSQCPLCKAQFKTRPELQINTFISGMASEVKKLGMSTKKQRMKTCSDAHKPPLTTPEEVPCDVCTEKKLMAVKSCLVCLVSFCETHLEPHHRLASYRKHILIDPVSNLEDRVCKTHEKPLERFCRSDQTYLCQFCTETEHKTHKTVSIEEEYGERKAELAMRMATAQQMIQERQQKITEIKTSVELSKKDKENEIANSVEVFTSLMRSIERSQTELINVIEKKQKQAERRAEELITELEQETSELKRRYSELEKISHIEDHLQFLQTSLFPRSFLPTKNWSEIRHQQRLCVGTVWKTVSQLEETLNEEMKKLYEMELRGMQPCIVDVTLDPDTANVDLTISEDRKEVKNENKIQKFPNKPNRFDQTTCVLGNEGFSSGKFYYEVQVKGKTGWVLGVVRESINRKGLITRNPENGHWAIGLWDDTVYKACAGPDVHLTLKQRPQKVGVFVDYEEGQVSFYNVEDRSHIYSFTGCNFTERLVPCFSTGVNVDGKNGASLIICPARSED
ncbi:hypothetical protein DPEC_G00244240 [Dallia pectoralis]|uniref:Uncharacterized protein n=1 Tax=Dallia pectoralis TaxID=75939 RepID=A0ACC2FVQ2_DALPE|nr:hypothetical protein DPEC_G00244240 [Dallia pectoralis]